MTSETEKLSSLLSHAMQNRAFMPVTTAEMLHALNSFTIALDTVTFCDVSPSTVKQHLHRCERTVANLIYRLNTRALNNFSGDTKYLLTQAAAAHKKLMNLLHWYCNGDSIYLYNLLPLKKLVQLSGEVDNKLKNNEYIRAVYTLLQPRLQELQSTKHLPYHRWRWWSKFCTAVLNTVEINTASIEHLLTVLNFNHPDFISYFIQRSEQELESCNGAAARLDHLSRQILYYNMMDTVEDGYILSERSVKQAMFPVLQTRLRCLQALPFIPNTTAKLQAISKLNTSLSVPQLALLVRLMVDAKIINEDNCSLLLKNIAGVVYTSRAAEISPESLRVNYYAPNNAAKNIVREHLVSMMNLLRSY